MSAHVGTRSSEQRYQRYKAVIDRLLKRPEFVLAEIHRSCEDERPAFVTRLVHELVDGGWLICDDDVSAPRYHWNRDRGEFSPGRWLDAKVFGSKIKETPQGDRPRERLIALGARHLRLGELLAILIRSGRPGESAMMAGDKLARVYQHRLQDLPTAGRGEMKAISSAVESTAWCQIMAGIELGRRISARSDRTPDARITSSTDAIDFCRHHFHRLVHDSRQEEFHIVTLDTKHRVIDTHAITMGTLDASLIHPREVFRPAIKDAAASMILVHNHPSGDSTPSKEDVTITRRLVSAGELLGIKVLDHIVLGMESVTSIHEFTSATSDGCLAPS